MSTYISTTAYTFSKTQTNVEIFKWYNSLRWAGDLSDGKSTSGYYVYLGNNLIMWSSKKQTTVSKLSTEAEYRVLMSPTA